MRKLDLLATFESADGAIVDKLLHQFVRVEYEVSLSDSAESSVDSRMQDHRMDVANDESREVTMIG